MSMGHIRNESEEQIAYAKDMFETIFKDFFSEKMQKDLIALMHDPEIQYVSGGHLSTILRADDYVKTIREFLPKI